MKEVLLSLMIWISQNSALVNEGLVAPEVKRVSNDTLAQIMFQGDVPAGYDENGLMALFNHHDDTIYVSERIQLETDYGQSVLLHELVHYMQFNQGEHKKVICLRELERPAYELQNQYMVSKGYDAPFDNMHIFFKSLCDNGTI